MKETLDPPIAPAIQWNGGNGSDGGDTSRPIRPASLQEFGGTA